jgi:hypothetical protein
MTVTTAVRLPVPSAGATTPELVGPHLRGATTPAAPPCRQRVVDEDESFAPTKVARTGAAGPTGPDAEEEARPGKSREGKRHVG